jgi:dephospho-CoA kinase
MLRLGLTGGIASGKSAVAAMLREMGFAVLDADSLAHKLVEPGQPAYSDVLKEFGPAVTSPDGRIGRAKLSAIVFHDRAKLDRLNAIVHPRVAEVVFRQFEEWERQGTRDAAFVEAALLIESGIHKSLDGLIVAWCEPEQQLQRLLARGLNEEEARRRIAAQLPVEEKLRYATEKINCSGSLDETRHQVEALAAKLRRAKGSGSVSD